MARVNLVVLLAVPITMGIATGVLMTHLYDDADGVADVDDPAAGGGAIRIQQPGAGMFTASLLAGSDGSPVLGDSDAPVTIIEWGDYQCTYCYLFHNRTLGQIMAWYVDTGKARIIFKDFVLNGPDSALAARASHCAGDQSEYWGYHDMLYRNWGGERTGWVTRDALDTFASTLGLDTGLFADCMGSQKHAERVDRLYASGRILGIDATPSFLIFNETHVTKVRGNQPLAVFTGTIDALLPPATAARED